MVRRILFIAIVLSGALQLWWSGIPGALAEEPSPEKLALTVAPSVLPADGNTHPVVYVQLMGPDGVPRLAPQDIEVSLISSNARVVRVPERVVISADESYTVASLTTTLVPGSAPITAVSRGRASATAEVETVSSLEATLPFRLALYAAPGNMLSGSQPPGRLSIVLLGANGRSIPAPESLTVVLNSSDPDVVRMAEEVTIPRGTHFVTTDLEPRAAGVATLSAVSSGFVSEFIEVHVLEPGETAEALVLHLSPPVFRSGAGTHRGVILQAVDDNGTPVYFPCTQVQLASSSPRSAEVTTVAGVACYRDVQYAVGTLTIGDLPGTSTITAVATGLRPASADLAVHGQVPVQLRAYLAPTGLLGVETTPGFLVVQVLDESGLPVTSHDDIPIKLVGGDGMLPDEAVIPGDRSFVRIGLGGLQPERQVELWLVSPNLASAQVSVKSRALPTSAKAVISEGPLFPGDQKQILIQVRSSGSPLTQASLTWTATNGILSDATPETDENGEGRAVFSAREPGDGVVEVVVTKVGYEDAKARTTIAVVAPVETSNPPPKLFGIPVLYLFLAIPIVLLGYVLYKFFPAVKRLRR